eukprot:1411780-Rhodomonas_salina.3
MSERITQCDCRRVLVIWGLQHRFGAERARVAANWRLHAPCRHEPEAEKQLPRLPPGRTLHALNAHDPRRVQQQPAGAADRAARADVTDLAPPRKQPAPRPPPDASVLRACVRSHGESGDAGPPRQQPEAAATGHRTRPAPPVAAPAQQPLDRQPAAEAGGGAAGRGLRRGADAVCGQRRGPGEDGRAQGAERPVREDLSARAEVQDQRGQRELEPGVGTALQPGPRRRSLRRRGGGRDLRLGSERVRRLHGLVPDCADACAAHR